MSNGDTIAAQIKAGLAEAGEATGIGRLYCTLRRPATGGGEPDTPWSEVAAGDPTDFELIGVQTQKNIRDINGTLTGRTETTLMLDATNTTPLKSDLIAVNVRKADVDANTSFHEIADVETLAPGGVPLMHKVRLVD
jgi:hypothetical protein